MAFWICALNIWYYRIVKLCKFDKTIEKRRNAASKRPSYPYFIKCVGLTPMSFKFRESLVTILLRQYETAKLRESQDPVVIQLLSPPTYPEIRSKPERTKIVILATLLGGFLAVFAAFTRHFLTLSAKDPILGPRVNYVKETILADLIRIKRYKK